MKMEFFQLRIIIYTNLNNDKIHTKFLTLNTYLKINSSYIVKNLLVQATRHNKLYNSQLIIHKGIFWVQ